MYTVQIESIVNHVASLQKVRELFINKIWSVGRLAYSNHRPRRHGQVLRKITLNHAYLELIYILGIYSVKYWKIVDNEAILIEAFAYTERDRRQLCTRVRMINPPEAWNDSSYEDIQLTEAQLRTTPQRTIRGVTTNTDTEVDTEAIPTLTFHRDTPIIENINDLLP
jgi:hypothetical protein